MEKSIKSLMLKTLAVIAPFIVLSIIVPIMLSNFPLRFYDEEFGWYQQNKDYAESHADYCRVLIMGDSTAKAAWLPAELSDDAYNFALGGASPIEEYYCLRDYLKENKAPEYVIYTQVISHFLDSEVFWSRSAYFHRLEFNEVYDTYKNEKTVLDEKIVFDDKDLIDIVLYYIYSPIYFSSAFMRGLFSSRQEFNEIRYEEAVSNRGRVQMGNGIVNGPASVVKDTFFACNKLIDTYLRKIIDLCDENGIQFIFQTAPVSELTYVQLNADLVDEYDSYIKSIQTDYPNVVMNGEFFYYDTDLFYDRSHLSIEGAIKFSREMREKYAYIFDEECAI